MAKVLITGANGGFGLLTVDALIAAGHKVAASMRDIDSRNKQLATELNSKGVNVVEIDVTNEQSVEQGVAAAAEKLGGLDVVINNAGLGVHGFTEAFTADDMKQVFDINVNGVHRVQRAVLPLFRSQSQGLIVNISSLLGRMTIPFYGPYNASKWALEALTENTRVENSAFGIDVAMIEPGGFPTNFFGNLLKPSDTDRLQGFGDYADAPRQALEGFEAALAANPAQDPQLVADAIVELIGTPAGSRKFRTTVDHMGMGEHIEKYNDHLSQLTEGIYTAFGTDGMLKLNHQ